ncbi:MAG: SusC/RagA family TonB-linked outer membrane protein, partial [Chitinophagaceae bacterium]|nr:SusC/RagA family TonB-linked outer membrane protein [Chitinophagaceae bacterium]
MKKTIAFVILLAFAASSLFAQTKTVAGRVTDAGGAGVPGAAISAGGRAVGTTNADGRFSVSVPANTSSIRISSIGFADKDVPVTGAVLAITLSSAEATNLNEVVVTGYSTIQRKKFSGAIAPITGESVRRPTFGSFDQALQGQASGVSVVSNSGQPGSNAIVRIRGNGSINGSNVPLYIMDGIEINAADFASLNANDFDKVEVLKDAVATGMYGSRGANGVIVITTRRGRSGTLQLNYDAQLGWSKLPKDRLVVMNSSQKIDYELQRGNPYGWTVAEQDSLRKVNFNWRDALFQTGITQEHNISASGGTAASRFFASLGYMKQDGILKTTGLERYSARINVDNNIKNWRFGINLQLGYSKIVGTSEANTFLSSPLNAIRWGNPYERDINPNTGDFQETGGPGTGELTSGQPNAAMELYLNYNYSLQTKAVATTYLEFHLPAVPGLYARTNWGVDYTNNETAGFTSPRTSVGIARQGILTRATGRNTRYTGTTSLNYKRTFGKHDIDGGIFTEVVKNDSRNFSFTGYGFTNGFTNEAGITAGSATNPNYIPAVGGGGTQNGILSYFAILNYGYNDKYFLNLVGRRDGSSRFGGNNRWANFGSVGATWVIAQEPFMEKQKFFNDLRLRASIGTNGNQNGIGDYNAIPLFGRVSYAGVAGWAPSSPGNADLKWETNRTINFGLDFSVLNRRLSGTVELYDRKTINLLYNIPLDPSGSGFTSLPSNFGSLRNRGIELSLRGDVIQKRDFRWTLEGNLTWNQNRILDLIQDSSISGIGILAKGQPLNSLYLVESAGVDPATGNALYMKRDKSGTTAVFSVNDKVIVGTTDAPLFGSIGTRFEYKGFDLSATAVFFFNKVIYNNDRGNVINPTYYFDNMSVEVLREWRKPGDITDVPRPSSGTNIGTGVPAPANPYQSQVTRLLESGDFWRLRNVTLGYTFKESTLRSLGLKSARV